MANNTGIKYGGRRTETKHNPYTHFLEAKQSLGYNYSYLVCVKRVFTGPKRKDKGTRRRNE